MLQMAEKPSNITQIDKFREAARDLETDDNDFTKHQRCRNIAAVTEGGLRPVYREKCPAGR